MTETDLVLGWARAFGLTLAVEGVVAVSLLRSEVPLPRAAALVALAQLVTHPLLWFVLPPLFSTRAAFLVVAETWAWLGETAFYAVAAPSLSVRRAALVSLAANAASLGAGLVLRAMGVPV